MEIEPDWASMDPRTIVGDATVLPFEDDTFDCVATSPCYGNRMADSFNARDGTKRNPYHDSLGRPPTDGSAGKLQWTNEKCRRLHEAAWAEVFRVLKPDGLLVLNMKDHVRKGKMIPVTDWHLGALRDAGFVLSRLVHVDAPGNRHGANGDARAKYEVVVVFEKKEL